MPTMIDVSVLLSVISVVIATGLTPLKARKKRSSDHE